jgi:PAS domain S-box-containing protein
VLQPENMDNNSLKLLHELEVHQIELETQNAALLHLKEQAEVQAEKYLELYDSAPSGYFTLSEEGEILELNLAGAQMLGKERSRLSNVRFGIFVSPETRSIFNLFIEKVFASQSKETCEVILSKDETLPVDVNLTGIVKAGGANCFVTAVDISERTRTSQLSNANIELLYQNDEKAKRAAELIIANKELLYQNDEKAKRAVELVISNELISFQRDRLQKIACLVPGVVYQYRLHPDGSSCFPYASEAIRQIYNVSPEEVREDAAKVFANIHPDDFVELVNSIQTSAKELTHWQHEYRTKFDDGTIRTVFGNALPQTEADGSVLWTGFITDITESKQARQQLQESEARYSSMISNISDVIAIMDADGQMTFKSANIEKFFGWLPEERIGTSGFATVHPDDIPDVQNVFYSLLGEENSMKTLEFRYLRKDGTYKPIELTASNQLNIPAINGVLLNYRDISERKEREQKINVQNEQLHKLNAEKDKFFSIIAHDLRGPMGLFMQLTELLADKETVLSADEVSEMIDDMSNLAQNTFNLLEELLEWSQISRGYYDFNPERIILNKVVAECFKILTDQARRKGIELVDNISNEMEVIADKNMLQSVIRNLFSNAIKFTSEGGKVTISAQTAENNQISVSVKDTGIGMTEDLRNELFRIDSNTKRPGTNGEKSAGLGLLLCKEFVEKQGGKISVESEQKIGSVFSFTLPLTGLLPKKDVPEIVVPPHSQKRPLKNLNILIAEDDEITLKLISYFIKGISNQVFKAKTGEEAVEICRNHPEIDLVIMDIKMPAMDGYEATRQIRQFNPRIVILADSTFTLPSDLELAIEAGCNDYLLKPFSREVFEGMIQKYV